MAEEFNLFRDQVSELSIDAFPAPTDRDLEQELFGKKGVKEAIDAYENELGFGKNQRDKKVNRRVYNRIFSPDDDDERKLLDELLNDQERFQIIMMKDTWTVHGNYKVFVIYSENLDAKKDKKETDSDE